MIVIATTPGREYWVEECMKSLNRPCLVLSDFGYELGKIKWCANNLKSPFFFFQDSVIFKNTDWIDELFNRNKSVALTNDPDIYGMYMGIYLPEILQDCNFPIVQNKADSVKYEIEWTRHYVNQAINVDIAFSDLRDATSKKKVIKHGKECLVLENKHIVKFKSNWGQKPALD